MSLLAMPTVHAHQGLAARHSAAVSGESSRSSFLGGVALSHPVGSSRRGAGMVCMATADGVKGSVKRKKLSIQKLVDKHQSIVVPGVYDALSAKIVAKQGGFYSAFVSGYAVSAAHLGQPDVGLLTAPEMASITSRICDAAAPLALLTDADTGGGGPINVQRTIKDLIKAGSKGCFIEDQVWPKKCGHMRGKQIIIPMEEMVEKIKAARAAIGGEDFFLVARTDARAISSKTGLDEAIERVNAYHAAGADGTFIEAPRSREELAIIGKETQGVKVANMLEGGVTPMLTQEELQELGFNIIIHPLSGIYAATKRLQEVYGVLAVNGTTIGAEDAMATLEDFQEALDLAKVREKEAMYAVKEDTTA